uniref:Secreted protein n=1 Tax=Macaca nemestrina TaxID=9545 RepID=A0A2K6DY10_MACNE
MLTSLLYTCFLAFVQVPFSLSLSYCFRTDSFCLTPTALVCAVKWSFVLATDLCLLNASLCQACGCFRCWCTAVITLKISLPLRSFTVGRETPQNIQMDK